MTQPETGAGTQIMLAEYTALRTEIERRTTVQWNVFALQLASAGAIAGVAISAAGNLALLLLIPLSSYLLGSRYILHDFHVKLIRRYLRDSLAARLSGHLQWEVWRRTELSTPVSRGWFSVTGWNLTQPTRLAFEGVAVLALVAGACAAAYRWWLTPTTWPLLAGAGAGWSLGAVVIVALHRAFERASDL
ncbi:hypothetical protein [Actinophytocola sp.]|uniref:hypothetical protein n=1 Tax=Actinophytocola sp. TaxID=1872138 RepID=UPI003899D6FD